jgi:hypothetical protein
MKNIVALLLTLLAGVPLWASAADNTYQPDQLSRLLFDAYIKHYGKVNTSTLTAASHIIAERGRSSGFWREVFAEFEKQNEQSEIGCVPVLEKMLAIDAAGRDAIRKEKETGETCQWKASVALGLEVVAELVSRARKADRFRADHYAIVLARARVPAAINFFHKILRDEGAERSLDSTRFHAALGLAQLGDSTGFEWLIGHSDHTLPTVSNAWPGRVSSVNLNLGACCIATLQQLSGNRDIRTKQEWEAWWARIDKRKLPTGPVNLLDP